MLPAVTLNIISICTIIGLSYSTLLTILIALKYRKNRANIYLALALLSFGLSIVYGLFHDNNLIQRVPGLMWFGFPFQLLQGPAIYLYVKKLINPKKPLLKKTDLLHSLPFILYQLWLIPFYSGSRADKLKTITGEPSSFLYNTGLMQLSGIVIMIQVVTYITLIMIILLRYSASLKKYFSSVHKKQLSWLLFFCGGYTLVWGLFILAHSLGVGISGIPLADFLPVLVTMAILFVGVRGLGQDTIFLPASFSIAKTGKYSGSTLKPGEAELIRSRLKEQLFEKKIFTEPDLTLADLASEIRCPTHHLSQVINQYYQTNFNDFINNERVKLAAEKLENQSSMAILQIAMDSGFGTKSSFNSFFKKTYNMTPSVYRRLKSQN